MLLSPLSVSSIAYSISSAAVSAGKEVKAGTGTSAQCGMGRRADSIDQGNTSFSSFADSIQTCSVVHYTKITIVMVIFRFTPYHRNPKPHRIDFALGPKAQRFSTLFAHFVRCPRLVLVP